MNRIVIILLVAAILLVSIGTIYIFFFSSPMQDSQQTANGTPRTVVPQQNSQQPGEARLNYWAGIIKTSISTNSYEGIISSVEDKSGEMRGVEYRLAIGIKQVESGNDSERFLLIRTQDQPIVKYYDSTQEAKREIKFSDLEPGDKINIIDEIDLMADPQNNRLKLEITKL